LAALLGLSPKTLQRWETGATAPNEDQLAELAEQLGVLPDFFFSPEIEVIPDDAVSFRALTKMTAAERDGATASGRLGVEFMRWVETRFDLPTNNVPTLTGWRPELAAEAVRERWNIGSGLIRQLLPVCELHGIRVMGLAPDYHNVDAFSFYDKGTPFVFLNTTKTAERLRFDLAHELGHLIMHGEYEVCQGREAETQANDFASAFLMPRDSVLSAGLFGSNVDQVIRAKSRWHVAAMALAHRLNSLGLVTEWGYRSLCVELSKRGFRRSEPGSQLRHESSQILGKVMTALRADGFTTRRIAAEIGLPTSEFAAYLFGLAVTSQDGGGNAPQFGDRPRLEVVGGTAHA
jgi:Zn-dependent peptidase ImmA (M78 family)